MTAIATRGDKLGSVLKHEYAPEHGYCRQMLSVTLTATSEIGDVLYDNSGNLALVDVANTANASAVLIDKDVYTQRPASGSVNVELAVLVRGPAVVADASLNYAADINTPAEITALHAVLEGLGILVREQV